MTENRMQETKTERPEEMVERTTEERAGVATEALFEVLKKRGMDLNTAESGQKKQKKSKNAFHNTQLLLQHYRTMTWMLECFPVDVAQELDKPFQGVDRLLEQMDMELSWGNRKLEKRMDGIEKSRLLMDRVNEALTVLKKKPEDGERLYRLIYLTYIAPEKLSHKELLYRLDLSSRHYYRLKQQAITILSIRLWSAPTQDVEIWLDMLAILEQNA